MRGVRAVTNFRQHTDVHTWQMVTWHGMRRVWNSLNTSQHSHTLRTVFLYSTTSPPLTLQDYLYLSHTVFPQSIVLCNNSLCVFIECDYFVYMVYFLFCSFNCLLCLFFFIIKLTLRDTYNDSNGPVLPWPVPVQMANNLFKLKRMNCVHQSSSEALTFSSWILDSNKSVW